ncbi:MAG: FAD-dependent oxidoreductase [Pseudomonadota bacterium]
MTRRIAVVGAGVAGLSCAHRLAGQGHGVTVFDKGRSIGGRLATRQSGNFRFDHGAPYVHAEGAAFQSVLTQLIDARAATEWPSERKWHVTGLPGMNGLLTPLTEGLDLRMSTTVRSLEKDDTGWTVTLDTDETLQGFDAVAVCIPAAQAATLTAPLGLGWAGLLADVAYAPCMTMMVAFEKPLPIADEQSIGAQPGRQQPSPIKKQLRNSAKPNRPTDFDHWVVHADVAWSEQHKDTDKPIIADLLLAEFRRANNLDEQTPAYLSGHRWRFSQTSVPLGQSHLMAAQQRIGIAGDWCLGPCAEHAFESGVALSGAILSSLDGA